MKRKIIILVSLLVLTGCTLFQSSVTPRKVVEDFFGKYQSLNSTVMDQLDGVISDENLTAAQNADYKELMKKQYQKLTYTIKNETVDNDTAVVTTEIEVYNYAKANQESQTYMVSHEDEFTDTSKEFSKSSYETYKLNKLKAVNDKIKYTLDLELTKTGKEWKLNNLSDVERQKIHGLYSAA